MFGKRILTASAMLLATAIAAHATDILPPIAPAPPPAPPPPPPAFSWSGPYVGLIGGYLWAYKEWDPGTTVISHQVTGFLIGAEAGYRFQSGSGLVFGAEIDWAWTNATGSGACPNPAFTCTTNINWLGTLTGQVGFAFNNFLLYAEAGGALADEDFATANGTTHVGNLVNLGWLVGGGVAVGLSNGLYLKAEYNYMNFGTTTVDPFTDGVTNTPFDLTQRLHRVTVGLGFMF